MGAAAIFDPGRNIEGVSQFVAGVLGCASRLETWLVVIGFTSQAAAVTRDVTPPLGHRHVAQVKVIRFTRGRETAAIGASPSI